MSTTALLDISLPRTLDAWVTQFEQGAWRGALVQGWLFEGSAARRSAERRLTAVGVHAELRSAYKPLVFHFLEELESSTLASLTITYPVHPQASPQRFIQEAYPLAALLPHCQLNFVPGSDDLYYHLALTHKDGSHSENRVWAPNRIHTDRQGVTLLSPTGWLRVTRPDAATPEINAAQQTDYEQIFEHILQTVEDHPWPAQEPYFERLDIRVDLPGIAQTLPVAHETISSFEALHEDIYFSLLEVFQRRSGREALDRRLQPGQIVPDVRPSLQAPRLRISQADFDVPAQDQRAACLSDTKKPLAELTTAASPTRISAEMARLGHPHFTATSRQGRRVPVVYHAGAGAAVLISGGQHANETSGVVGALRAADCLKGQANAHFALIALENPDGYALHRELRAQHPLHMHHAARYSALGDDIEYRENLPLYEREARLHALALSGAQLHINLHGYPAHEWTRPLSGYVPRGFELWTIPKGFFLILRYHPGWKEKALALLEQVTAALAELPGFLDFNANQMALYERHAGALPFAVLHGTAYTATEMAKPGTPPVTLITEFPDETIEGAAFRFAHTVQMQTVLAAVTAWQALAPGHKS